MAPEGGGTGPGGQGQRSEEEDARGPGRLAEVRGARGAADQERGAAVRIRRRRGSGGGGGGGGEALEGGRVGGRGIRARPAWLGAAYSEWWSLVVVWLQATFDMGKPLVSVAVSEVL
ncbi:hypothetical protein ABZP36_006570 [Zizania latifolia]